MFIICCTYFCIINSTCFFVFGTKSRFIIAFLKLKFLFFKCFESKSVFGAGASRSRAFTSGGGAEIFYPEPETEPGPKIKVSGAGAGAEDKWFGSATLGVV